MRSGKSIETRIVDCTYTRCSGFMERAESVLRVVENWKGECLSKTKRTIDESAIIDMLNGRWRSRGVVTTAHTKVFADRLWDSIVHLSRRGSLLAKLTMFILSNIHKTFEVVTCLEARFRVGS